MADFLSAFFVSLPLLLILGLIVHAIPTGRRRDTRER